MAKYRLRMNELKFDILTSKSLLLAEDNTLDSDDDEEDFDGNRIEPRIKRRKNIKRTEITVFCGIPIRDKIKYLGLDMCLNTGLMVSWASRKCVKHINNFNSKFNTFSMTRAS